MVPRPMQMNPTTAAMIAAITATALVSSEAVLGNLCVPMAIVILAAAEVYAVIHLDREMRRVRQVVMSQAAAHALTVSERSTGVDVDWRQFKQGR